MAEEDEQPQEGAEAGGGKKKMLLLVAVGLVLIGLSVGGTLLALQLLAPEPAPVAGDAAADAEAAEPVKQPAIYFPLKPPIVVNFQARGRQRFLQAEVTLMARENQVIEAIELHMPMIRNSLVLLFGGQIYEELQTAEGKELLRQQALEQLQALLQQEIDQPGIEQVLFTNFVMQ